MQETNENCKQTGLVNLCAKARKLITDADYDDCYKMICTAMQSFPDSPHPHNLYGILMEKEGCHAQAMRHFRAAYALDPTYAPARQNLELFGTFCCAGGVAFDESDCKRSFRC